MNHFHRLLLTLIKESISKNLLLEMLAYTILISWMTPYLVREYTNELISGSADMGMFLLLGSIFCEILTGYQQAYFLNPIKFKMDTKVSSVVEKFVLGAYSGRNLDDMRQLQTKDIQQICQNAKWPLIGLTASLIDWVIRMMPFVGYLMFLLSMSPMSVLIYTLAVLITYKFINHKASNWKAQLKNWTKYSLFKNNLWTDTAHGESEKTIHNMTKLMEDNGNIRNERICDSQKKMEMINLVFNCAFALNAILFVRNLTNPASIIIFCQYSNYLKSYLTSFTNVKTQYLTAKKEFDILAKNLFDLPERIAHKQVDPQNSIQIKSLTFKYPNFVLTLVDQISFTLGQSVLLLGDSGHGKSTFADIFSGVIPCFKYNVELLVDYKQVKTFEGLMKFRVYVEQNEKIIPNASIFQLVCNNLCANKEDQTVVDRVMQALKVAQALDFVSETQISDKKWIHDEQPHFSGGQAGRVCIARAIFRLLSPQETKIAVFDEIDKAVQGDMAKSIMEDIFALCKQRGILCLTIAHSTEVKNMNYDQVIKFNNGQITLQNK